MLAIMQAERKFTIKGWLYDHITLTWKNGKLLSDRPDIQKIIEERIQQLEEIQAFVLCPDTRIFYTENYLKEPLSAYLVLKHILDVVYEAPDKKEVLRLSQPVAAYLPL